MGPPRLGYAALTLLVSFQKLLSPQTLDASRLVQRGFAWGLRDEELGIIVSDVPLVQRFFRDYG